MIARLTIARLTTIPHRPSPVRFLRRMDAGRVCGIPEYRCWRDLRQSPDGGTRLRRARAPDHASAEYRSWSYLLLVSVVREIIAIVVPRRQTKLADFVAHRPQAY